MIVHTKAEAQSGEEAEEESTRETVEEGPIYDFTHGCQKMTKNKRRDIQKENLWSMRKEGLKF